MTQLSNLHEDMIHDCALDYYGKRLATCSSDKTVKVFEVSPQGTHRLLSTLTAHTGPVWQVSWAHPKFGNILASASYDGTVIIWTERNGTWATSQTHANHHASVNAVSWGPHEIGAIVAAASSDGNISVMEMLTDGSWDTKMVTAHPVGANAVSWAPATQPGSLVQGHGATAPRRFVTGGSDNTVKIWVYKPDEGAYSCEHILDGHQDWVRDVAWAPSILPKSYIATASQDKTVIIWSSSTAQGPWKKIVLQMDTVLWRVSWSLSGNVLAISGGDNKVTLWKETLKGDWERVQTIEE